MSRGDDPGPSDRPNVVRVDGGPTRSDKNSPAPGSGMFGMVLFLASLSMLFAASMVAYVLIRIRADEWRPEGVRFLPHGVWVSTLLLVGVSWYVQRALNSVRGGQLQRLVPSLTATLALSVGFVLVQVWNGFQFHDAEMLYGTSLYGFTFYMLTGLHAAHVIGGLVGQAWVLHRARQGAYSWAYYPGVRYMAVYWHYLGVVWLVLIVALVLGSL